jgi:hypothetical protein
MRILWAIVTVIMFALGYVFLLPLFELTGPAFMFGVLGWLAGSMIGAAILVISIRWQLSDSWA